MVAKSFNQFLAQKYPQLLQPIHNLDQFHGKRAAIDTKLFLYQFKAAYLASIYNRGVNDKGEEQSWLFHPSTMSENFTPDSQIKSHCYFSGFVEQWKLLQQHNIEPIYVFDGKPPQGKQSELKRRQERRQKLKQDIEQLELILSDPDVDHMVLGDTMTQGYNYNPIRTYTGHRYDTPNNHQITCQEKRQALEQILDNKRRQWIEFKESDIELLIQFFRHNNIQYVELEHGDAEHGCAYLIRKQWADFVITNDIDTIAYGAPLVLRQISWSLLRSNSSDITTTTTLHHSNRNTKSISLSPHVLDTRQILGTLKMQWDAFLEFFMLCGTDVAPKIPGIAHIRAFSILNKYGSVSQFLKRNSKDKKLVSWRRKHYAQFCHAIKMFQSEPVLKCSNVPMIQSDILKIQKSLNIVDDCEENTVVEEEEEEEDEKSGDNNNNNNKYIGKHTRTQNKFTRLSSVSIKQD